jgi:hypothetical protein
VGTSTIKSVRPLKCEHVVVYRRNDEYAGWPFNGGIWNFGDDILVGFVRNKCAYRSPQDVDHRRVQYVGGQFVVIRSGDGGRTWLQDELQVLYGNKAELHAKVEYHLALGELPKPPPLDFTSGSAAVATEPPLGSEVRPPAYFVTGDKGRTWHGPYVMHVSGFRMIHARPSYIIDDEGGILFFVQGLRNDEIARGYAAVEPEGRPMVIVSEDGAASWRFLSYILPPNPEFPRICPAPAALPDGRIVVALRVMGPAGVQWTELYASEDGGLTWKFVSRVNRWGAPASLLVLRDGRLLCVYGYRVPPYGVRARISDDGGETWGPEIVIRDDGGSWDLGYPRATELPNGKILTVYYFNDRDDPVQCEGGVRYIAATVFALPY